MDRYSFLSLSIKLYCVEFGQIIFSLNLEVGRKTTSSPWASIGIQVLMHLDLEGVAMCKHHCCIHISVAILSSEYTWIETQ